MKIYKSGLVLAVCLALCGCASIQNNDEPRPWDPSEMVGGSDVPADTNVKLLRIHANVDGTGRIIFSDKGVRYQHKNWSPPKDVSINDQAWTDLNHTPAFWKNFSKGLDLSRAWIVKRQGRDVIALEQTAKGFDLYLCDSPNGSADYEVTIAIPRRE